MFAPTLAITIVIGINIKKAGIFINPTLNGKLAFRNEPVIKKPIAPNKEITEIFWNFFMFSRNCFFIQIF